MRIVMLDACRNNPFPALSQTAGHGLAIVDTKAGAPGSFISYSTSPGSEAEDGTGADSPYTTALLSVAKEPNLPIEEAFKRVRVAVSQATDGRQIPWESSSLTADFKFFPANSGAQGAAAPKAPAKAARSVDDWRGDLQGKEPKVAYDLVIANDTVEAYEVFVALFAQSSYNARVRSLLERRREMLAWETAVTINTAASFEAFLASYANSDLAATAHKMQQRVLNRTLGANAALTAPVAQPTNVALAPTGPCPAPPTLPLKKVDAPPSTKQVDTRPPRRGPPPEEIIVERRPPGYYGPPPVYGPRPIYGPRPGYFPPGVVIEGYGFGGRGGDRR
jgi:hypothetical protein